MVDNRISKARIQHHFTYGIWKYVLVAVVTVFAWDLLFNATAYRPQANKKLDVYFVVQGADPSKIYDELETDLRAAFPDQEAFNFLQVAVGDDMAYEGAMQLMAYIAAGQGDLFLFSVDQFRQYGREEGGFFLRLDDAIASSALNTSGLDMTMGELAPIGLQPGIYGFPAQTQYKLTDYGINNHSLVWGIPEYSGNKENAVKLIAFLQQHLHSEKPEWYDEYQEKLRQQEQDKLFFAQ